MKHELRKQGRIQHCHVTPLKIENHAYEPYLRPVSIIDPGSLHLNFTTSHQPTIRLLTERNLIRFFSIFITRFNPQ